MKCRQKIKETVLQKMRDIEFALCVEKHMLFRKETEQRLVATNVEPH